MESSKKSNKETNVSFCKQAITDHVYRMHLHLSVNRYLCLRPTVDTWLTSWSTLDKYLDWYSVDTRPTFDQHPNWHLISSVLIVGWVLTNSHVDWYLMVCLQKLVDSWLNILIDWVLSKYRSIIDVYGAFIKYWSNTDLVSIEMLIVSI